MCTCTCIHVTTHVLPNIHGLLIITSCVHVHTCIHVTTHVLPNIHGLLIITSCVHVHTCIHVTTHVLIVNLIHMDY